VCAAPLRPAVLAGLVRDTEAGGLAIVGVGDHVRAATVAEIAETRIDLSARGGREPSTCSTCEYRLR
jgi:hypothetical protein